MTVRVNKSAFNIREKLSELERPIGVKGNELMRAETAQDARDFVSAGRKNLVINGDMRIAQRGTSATISGAADDFVVDRFYLGSGGGFSWNSAVVSQSTTAPDGFNCSLKVDVGSTSTPTGGHNAVILQKIEAQNLQSLAYGTAAAKTCTLSFWVRSNKTGTYCLQIIQEDAGSNYVMYEYTIDSVNTWEKKTITIVGNTSGSISNDNGQGLQISWHLAVGSNDHVATQSTWSGSVGYRATANQVNLFDNASNEWYLTGVQLEVGKNATEFEHRSYGEELALCQRYFWIVPNARWLNGYKRHDSYVFFQLDTPVPMRTSPTPTITSVGVFTNHQSALGGAVQTTGTSVFEYRPDSGRGTLQISSTYSGTHTIIPSWEAGTIEFNAEL